MDWVVNGLPVHALLVHAVVIIVPLAALCLVLGAAWPAARRRLGIVTPLVALAALVTVPLTVAAGQWLMAHVAMTPLIAAHTTLGPTLLPWVVMVFIVAVLQWLWFGFVLVPESRVPGAPRSAGARRAITLVLAAAVLVTAIGSVVTVVQIGESGSRAIWTNSFTP